MLLIAVAANRPFCEGADRFAAALHAMTRLGFSKDLQSRVQRAASSGELLSGIGSAADAHAILERLPIEGAAIIAALAGRRSPGAGAWARDWIETKRHLRLEIDGEDLLAAGVPPGPEVGIRLAAALAGKRDGAVAGREQELRAALDFEIPAHLDA